MNENPFKSIQSNENLYYATINYVTISVKDCPIPVFIEHDLPKLYKNANIGIFRLGIHRYLTIE